MSGHRPITENSVEKRLEAIMRGDLEERNKLIADYIPFIIKMVSKQLNRYIETENCDEFSIGLIAFDEAIDKYCSSKGVFLKFAELVISNRIKDALRKKNQELREISFEDCSENVLKHLDSVYVRSDEDSISLREEIKQYESELSKFKITLEDLVEETPKHKDTRVNAMILSERISEDKPLVEKIYSKRRLPISQIALKFKTTAKIIKRSRKYIISLVVIFTGGFIQLKYWVRNSIKG
ncbi:MAG: hypothetical protein APF84_06445 [Gracilibacter sp. BRH_c7a]|nr:MAG: hypothetical protein APF84_06445 [Gracilibacter sp. BRH_c7a]